MEHAELAAVAIREMRLSDIPNGTDRSFTYNLERDELDAVACSAMPTSWARRCCRAWRRGT